MLHLSLFLAFGALCIGGAINLLVQKHPISSALSLIVVMGSLAVEYLLLGAEFVAVIQVIIYAGAIMVLFVFVIMLLNAGAEQRSRKPSLTVSVLGLPALLAFLGFAGYFFQRGFANAGEVKFGNFTGGSAEGVGIALFTRYLLPFEVTSVLILVAIVGAIVLARKEID